METSEIPSENIKRLIGLEITAEELLGDNWREKCYFKSLDQFLTSQEIKTILQKEAVHDPKTKTEKTASEINKILASNKSPYKAYVVSDESEHQIIYIEGFVGKDLTSQFIKNPVVFRQEGKETVIWQAEKLWFIGKNGCFFLNPLLKGGLIEFTEVESEKYQRNRQGYRMKGGVEIVKTLLPQGYSEICTLFHELGHLLRRNYFRKAGHSILAADTETRNVFLGDWPRKKQITNYQVRQAVSKEERGAFAIAFMLLREANRSIGLDCGTPGALQEIKNRSETGLASYDTVPYSHDEEKTMPAFSTKQRRAARQLEELMEKRKIAYRDLPQYDPQTGEHIAGKPEKIIRCIKDNFTE